MVQAIAQSQKQRGVSRAASRLYLSLLEEASCYGQISAPNTLSHEAHPEPAHNQELLEWRIRWAEVLRLGNPVPEQGSLVESSGYSLACPEINFSFELCQRPQPPLNLSVDTETVLCLFLGLLDTFRPLCSLLPTPYPPPNHPLPLQEQQKQGLQICRVVGRAKCAETLSGADGKVSFCFQT